MIHFVSDTHCYPLFATKLLTQLFFSAKEVINLRV